MIKIFILLHLNAPFLTTLILLYEKNYIVLWEVSYII